MLCFHVFFIVEAAPISGSCSMYWVAREEGSKIDCATESKFYGDCNGRYLSVKIMMIR